MRFDRLKIVGFKTFVDPTEFRIEPGLTGIVGPNGCGKSNLVEALRWVMGETSHKSLRASGMDDVIFGGSGSRPSRDIAEVILRIDNSDKKAPAAFNDADILEISRRIERAEGSTYRVNNREVRARDVQLLFADAASGARSPSMVRQGQIGEIISAKPQARRRILEDAAGVAGLHSRRHEAELRLKAADDNLIRVEDVLQHIESQLESLRKQAKQAVRYRDVAGQIRRYEALLLCAALDEAKTQLAAAMRQLDLDTRAVAARMAEQGEAARAQAVAEHELEPLRMEEARSAAILQRLQIARETLDADEKRAKARIVELDRRLSELARDLDREKQLVFDAVEAADLLTREDSELAAREKAMTEAGVKAELQATTSEAALTLAETRLNETQAALADINARRAAAERALREAEQRLVRAQTQHDSGIQELTELQGRASGPAAEIARLMHQVEENTALLVQAELAAQQAELQQRTVSASEAALRPALAEAERNAQRLETEARTIRKMLDGGASEMWPPVVEKITVKKGYEIALGAALGDDLEASVEPGAPVKWGITLAASNDPDLPEGVEPLQKYVTAPAQLQRRLKQIGLVDKTHGSHMQAQLKPGQRLVTLQGDLWRWDGLSLDAEAPSPAARRLAEKNRLHEVESSASEAVARRDILRKQSETAIFAAREAANAETASRSKLRDARNTLDQCRTALSVAERRQGEMTSRLAALVEATSRLAVNLTESLAAQEQAKASFAGVDAGETLQLRLNEERGLVALARADAAEARAILQGLRREAEMRQNRRATISQEQNAWKTRSERADAQEAEIRQRLEGTKVERAALDDAPTTFAVQRRALTGEIDQAELNRRLASDKKAEGDTVFAQFDRLAKASLAALAESREARARSEARLEAVKDKIAEAERHIVEKMEVIPADLRRIAGIEADAALPEPAEVESLLADFKRERERLGAVNLRADDELKEVEETQENLVRERDDLVEAIKRLRRGIESLNSEGRQRLIAAFDVVNGHFKRLFSTLFGGGEAELTLIESDDPLEAGLEIIAKPPGKKPQVLTLLSGGEQALTASALIFAVFLTNPSPICVLDEIDAPLDDANVERLCNLLDEMVKETQTRFITITHNPITMARMDRLFGVTMAERGVSQLVSVDLNEASRLAEAS